MENPEKSNSITENMAIATTTSIAIKYPIPLDVSIWLVGSSFFFMVPAVYAFINSFYLYGIVSTITTVCSANHWREAEDGPRRTADRVVACVSFFIYFVTGCINLNNHVYLIGIGMGISMLTFYYFSERLAEKGNPHWVYCHFLFHIFVALGQFWVLYFTIQPCLR